MLITYQSSRQKISNSIHFDYEFLLLLFFITSVMQKGVCCMAIRVVEFSNGVYKIRKIFA